MFKKKIAEKSVSSKLKKEIDRGVRKNGCKYLYLDMITTNLAKKVYKRREFKTTVETMYKKCNFRVSCRDFRNLCKNEDFFPEQIIKGILPKIIMEKTRAKIIDALRRNCKKGYIELSREIGITPYHLALECREIEKSTRFVTLVNFDEMGYPIRLGIYLKTSSKEVSRFLRINPYVNNASKLKDYGYYAEVIFKNMDMLDKFFDALEKQDFEKKEVVYIVKEEKKERFRFFKD